MEEPSWRGKFLSVQEGASLEDFRGKTGNLIVVAPHPDDDILGAGGTMIEASEGGRGVFSIYLTDGRGSPRAGAGIGDEEMASRRQEEALAALKATGAAGGFFLGKRSGELEGDGGEVERQLREIFKWLAPAEVYLPAPYERHRTHQMATRISLRALRPAAGAKPAVMGYSLWGCFHGGKKRLARDISPYIRKKVEAVLAHATQVAYKGYQQGILGKNNAEAVFWDSREVQKGAFVETFVDMTEFLERDDLTVEKFIREDVESFLKKYL
jgi:N-acetylglucosamine malate deacetylase 1